MNNINNIFNFFIKNNSRKDKDFQSLKNLYNSFESSFIKDSIVLTLYDYIMNDHILFSVLLNNKELLSFLSSYNGKDEYKNKHKKELTKLKKFLFNKDTNLIENKDEILPYIIIESLIEYQNTEISFVPNTTDTLDEKKSLFIHDEILKFEDYQSFILATINMTNGYYLYETKALKHSDYFHGYKYNLLSIQNKGAYIYDLNAEIKLNHGITRQRLNTQTHLISKRHELEIKYQGSTCTDLSVFNKKSKFRSVLNELIYKAYIYWCDFNMENIKEEKSISLLKNESKSNLPIVSNYKTTTIPEFSFDELRFKGDFSFLSYLDDLFEDIIDLQYVNYYSSESNTIYDFYHIKDKPKKSLMDLNLSETEDENIPNYEFTKEYFNNFFIKKHDISSVITNGCVAQGFVLNKINPNFIGSEKEIYEYAFKVAKTNKIKLYNSYLNNLFKNKNFNNEVYSDIIDFFEKNISDILDDNDFYDCLDRTGFSKISFRNYYDVIKSGFHSFHTTVGKTKKEEESLYNISADKFKTLFKDIKSDKKAHNFIVFDCNNLKMLKLFETKYGLKASTNTETALNTFKATHKTRILREKIGLEKIDGIDSSFDSDIDAEYYRWLNLETFSRVVVPMSNKTYKEFNEKVEEFENIKKIDCSYGLTGILSF